MSNFDLGSIYFYVDEDLDSDQFVIPITDAGFCVVRHRDILPKGAEDRTWIAYVARRNWFAFSHNREISYLSAQVELVMKEGLGLFVVRGQSRHEAHKIWANKVIGAQTSIANFIKKNYRPFIASVSGSPQRYRINPLRPEGRDWNKGKMKAQKQLRTVIHPGDAA